VLSGSFLTIPSLTSLPHIRPLLSINHPLSAHSPSHPPPWPGQTTPGSASTSPLLSSVMRSHLPASRDLSHELLHTLYIELHRKDADQWPKGEEKVKAKVLRSYIYANLHQLMQDTDAATEASKHKHTPEEVAEETDEDASMSFCSEDGRSEPGCTDEEDYDTEGSTVILQKPAEMANVEAPGKMATAGQLKTAYQSVDMAPAGKVKMARKSAEEVQGAGGDMMK